MAAPRVALRPADVDQRRRALALRARRAAAVLGYEVELRGGISEPDLEEICEAAGARPSTGMTARHPAPGEVVVVPEGWTEPMAYARVALSPASCVLLMLVPPGLVGWPFTEDWSKPEPLKANPLEVAQPDHYQAMDGLGFILWTNSSRLAKDATAAGVPCTFIGQGQPVPIAAPSSRSHDLV
jgi:hypothetical protein